MRALPTELFFIFVASVPKISLAFSLYSPESSVTPGKFLILGLGRVGLEVAKQAVRYNVVDSAIGTVRNRTSSDADDDEDTSSKIQRMHFDDVDLRLVAQHCRYLLVTIPPSSDHYPLNGDDPLDLLFQTVLKEITPGCWIGLISTTGVYGNHDGAWVTEESECKCASDRPTSSSRYLDYESKWRLWASESSAGCLNIFRCAGIYSNDQSALHTVYRNGIQISDDADSQPGSVTNRIHVSDIGRAVVASMKRNQPYDISDNGRCQGSDLTCNFRVYNLADNLPENRDVVLSYAANLLESLGVSIPIKDNISRLKNAQDVVAVSTRRESRRLTDRKLVSNQRMLQELLPESGLVFPTYKEGLRSILDHRSNPWWTTAKLESE